MHVWNKDTKTAIKTKGQKEIFALLFLYMEIRAIKTKGQKEIFALLFLYMEIRSNEKYVTCQH